MERDEEEGREEGRRVGKICKRLGEQRKRTGRLFMGAILRIYELVPVESSRDVASRLLPVENVYRDVYIPGVSPWPRFARGHPSTRRHTSFLILPLPKTLNGERWRERERGVDASRISSRNRYARITIDIYIYICRSILWDVFDIWRSKVVLARRHPPRGGRRRSGQMCVRERESERKKGKRGGATGTRERREGWQGT